MSTTPETVTKRPHIIRRLYDWTLHWADTPHAVIALFILAFTESSFFPVPPDVLLIALCMGNYKKWWRFATVCSIASVIGGMFGYLIGFAAYDLIGRPIMHFIEWVTRYDGDLYVVAQTWFNDSVDFMGTKFTLGVWAVAIAGFTPIPYKVFTIAAGALHMSFVPFVIASALSRSARFFLVAGMIGILYKYYGEKIKRFIDKYFDFLTILFTVLLIGGFLVMKLLSGGNGAE
jgi:membrane protein YqaA with SNARE-associated domain